MKHVHSSRAISARFPHIGAFESTKLPGIRNDILGTTRHIERWRTDLELLRSASLTQLRYSVPWHRIERVPGVFDFSRLRYIAALRTGSEPDARLPPQTKKTKYRRQHHEPTSLDLRSELYRVFGVDLTDVPGISSVTAHTILCEVGTDLTRFRNASAFASWLGLCPEKQISGGKVLYTKSRRVKSRLATALRIGANSLHHANNYLGAFFRRIARRLGKAQAITATAHKLARIIFHVLTTKDPYNEDVFKSSEQEALRRTEMHFRKQAAQLGFTIAPAVTT